MDEEDDVIVKKRKTIKTLVDSDDDEDHVETEVSILHLLYYTMLFQSVGCPSGTVLKKGH
ncbi:unnamed protein product [Nippostrongylus brasiliensis]|uniref:Uncharacterized protein n=1 Tax=Nippostrongylus brasiliensis TaxID=27835 RepID=A0A0N4XGY6_NIPBR|nr:unnamed protein product [Nippostrongylus brasiliensis]